jgi:hypothetical protein
VIGFGLRMSEATSAENWAVSVSIDCCILPLAVGGTTIGCRSVILMSQEMFAKGRTIRVR